MRVYLTIASALFVAAIGPIGPDFAALQAQAPGLTVPLRISAWAVNMSNIATGTNAQMDISVTRWTTPDERKTLIGTFMESGQDPLLRALQRMPDHGRMRIPGWQGADPHQVRLGWTLRYAWNTQLPDGGQQIILATDRFIGFWEARDRPRTMDYPFTFFEIRIDKNGEGEGRMSVATKLSFNKETNTVVLENYSSEPVRLNRVRIEKG